MQFWKPLPVLSAAALAGVLVLSIALFRLEKPASHKPAPEVAMAVSAPPVATVQAAPHVAKVRAAPPAAPLAAPPAAPTSSLVLNGVLGTITDPAGTVLAGAAVSVRPVSGAPGVNATADNSGQFLITGLPPGVYEMQVSRPGFLQTTKKIQINKDELARADSSLPIGSVSESVEVSAASALVQTEPSLPGKLPTAATASKDKVTLAADTAGTLYRGDAGRKWEVVEAVWQGNVTALAADAAEFRLTTDTGAVWLSGDGSHWRLAPSPPH